MDGRVKRGPSRTWWLRVLGVGRCHELGGLGFWGLGDSGLGVGVSGRTRTGENLKSKLKSTEIFEAKKLGNDMIKINREYWQEVNVKNDLDRFWDFIDRVSNS